MKTIKRKMIVEDSAVEQKINECLPYCQASFNSDGNITLRNYDRDHKERDEIIILSKRETDALFELFSQIGQSNKRYDLPF